MKKLFSALLIGLLSFAVNAATVVQYVAPVTSGFNNSTTLTFGAPITSGNSAVVACRLLNTSTATATDSTSAVFTADVSALDWNTFNRGYIWSRHNITDAPTSVTVATSASAIKDCFAIEVAGITASLSDFSSALESTSSGFVTNHTVDYTSGASGDFTLAFVQTHNARTFTGAGDSTIRQITDPGDLLFVYESAPASGSQQLTFDSDTATDANAGSGGVMLATYAAGGGGSPPQPVTLQVVSRGFGPHPSARLGGMLQ